ncbi:MAG: DUF4256 domain-containing protein [Balneolales bacterium]
MNTSKSNKKKLSPEQREELLRALKTRFEKNMKRHKGLEWAKVQSKLEADTENKKLWPLYEMERTGGALFCDRRYDNVFVYHNGAQSYYASRGFRGSLRI